MTLFSERPYTLLDGSISGALNQAGMLPGLCREQWILAHPEVLVGLQRAYVSAGCDAVCAPTYGANRIRLSQFGLDENLETVNEALVSLSRSAVGENVALGATLAPLGFPEDSFETAVSVYEQQVRALEKAGVDFYLAERFTRLHECRAALLAVQSVSDKPVFVTVSVNEEGLLADGCSLPAALTVLQAMGVDGFGLSAAGTPEVLAPMISSLTPYATVPLIARPDGILAQGEEIKALSAETFVHGANALCHAGAMILGGGRGTSPAHLRALADHLPSEGPSANSASASFVTAGGGVRPLRSVTLPEQAANRERSVREALEQPVPEGTALWLHMENDHDVFELTMFQKKLSAPLLLTASGKKLLEQALRCYHGIALVRQEDEEIAAPYGACVPVTEQE